MAYGQIYLETKNFDECVKKWIELIDNKKIGDNPKDYTKFRFSLVLVENDDQFIDCEYRSPYSNEILTLEEVKRIIKERT